LWQRDRQKICEKPFDLLFFGDETLLSKLHQALRYGKEFEAREYRIPVPYLRKSVFEVSLRPIFQRGEIKYGLLSLQDVSEHLDKQAWQQQQQVNESMVTLAATLAHEIQNPLSGIKGATQLQIRDLEQAGMSTEPSEMVLEEIGRIERLLEQLLLHVAPMSLRYERFNIYEVLNTVLWFEENRLNRNLNFVREFDPSLPEIEGDRDKIHQVVLNLIRNAIEASPAGGEICLRSMYCSQWQLAGKNLNPHLRYIMIELKDQGPGVPPENQAQLFRPLFTTKRTGHGLGLSISYQIIHSHQGLLQYVDSEDGGATFQIYLPTRQKS
jgi:two-component system nitrogen regulation sensor histidine kinase GlnL